ncbi:MULTISPECIES: filamentous hemagglutinin N-terminal domain-containing protein [unclassified Nostoc]|uniref:two-partner secretion domain-containing protein n=1 Tax=unclassified Nostoc TaxID=2593658 RepID=UPI002AD2F60C|nr:MULTISPECIES: filamentous hemagglutinin N-terminal domain-containing protein [unclassified Nostoc]MDZ8121183.1 filamentous hemagglutinin N-terminal domain-containing protein [Nostoc sp. CmiVER01]MDZ8224505.1 filamentous hemagglutinin N-terminal domain-containing protein [Nostoc sp. ChiVER01]
MTENLRDSCWLLRLMISLAISGAYVNAGDCTLAQITPDNTLPTNSTVKLEGNTTIIEGGTRAGSNLFHSFEQFSVLTGTQANFKFDNAIEIQNIISRVTGGSVSLIDGLIKANGSANLFFINPNGIIFGPNAQLDIKGSFIATTANRLKFADGALFSAFPLQNTPLLTVSVPIGLQFEGTAGGIRVEGSDLKVEPGKTLALVGGDVTLQGGERAALKQPNLAVLGGRIELGSVAGVGEVSLNQKDNDWVLGYASVNNFGDIRLQDGAYVDVSGVGGGDVQIQSNNLALTQGSVIFADTQGTEAGGEVLVQTTTTVTLTEGSRITADVLKDATGAGGNVTIETKQLSIQGDGSIIRAGTDPLSKGGGGMLTVRASEFVELTGTITSGLFTETQGAGNAGKLTINTRRLSSQNGARVSTSTLGEGQGGNLTVTATDSVEVINGSSLFTETQGAKDAGSLTIDTGRLIIQDGAQVSTSTRGAGQGGNLFVAASDLVKLQGTEISIDGQQFPSFLATQAENIGDAGNLTINTRQLIVENGAQISTASIDQGKGGDIRVNATDRIIISGSSPFKRRVPSGGSEFVKSGLFVSSQGLGSAGNVQLISPFIRLDNGGKITAETASGNGGDIRLYDLNLLLLSGKSQISATAGINQQGGDGGNITIDAPNGFIVAKPNENSDITANAYNGNGGRVKINATKIFGIAPLTTEDLKKLRPIDLDPRQLQTNDITAISQTRPDLSGIVEINTLNVDPYRGLINLPAVPINTQVSQVCQVRPGENQSSFTITGRGGLPLNPITERLTPDSVQVNWVTLNPKSENHSSADVSTQTISSIPVPVVEAQGWMINAKGEVVLTANAPTNTLYSSWQNPANCRSNF